MANQTEQFDAIIIGAGHNGLVAAGYLARAGKKVAVLEKRDRVGGACTLEEPFPGFTMSPCAYVVSLLRPEIIRDLELHRYGFDAYVKDPQMFVLYCDHVDLSGIGAISHELVDLSHITSPLISLAIRTSIA